MIVEGLLLLEIVFGILWATFAYRDPDTKPENFDMIHLTASILFGSNTLARLHLPIMLILFILRPVLTSWNWITFWVVFLMLCLTPIVYFLWDMSGEYHVWDEQDVTVRRVNLNALGWNTAAIAASIVYIML